MPLFDESFLRRLEQLSLVARRIRAGHFNGDRRSNRRGRSVEFADYRNYVRGDDLRALDWNIYARLEKPFIKLFEEEIDQTVYIILDASKSMDWPQAQATATDDLEAIHKWTYTRRLAAALGYIALANNDRLSMACLSGQQVDTWGPERRRQRIHQLLGFLDALPADKVFDFNRTLSRYGQQLKRPGLIFFISDFLANESYQAGLSALQRGGHEVTVLHLLSPDEIEPELAGDFQLQDIETEASQDITINATMRQLYRQKFDAWQGDIASFCRRRNIHYALINTRDPFEQLILQHLRRRGFVR